MNTRAILWSCLLFLGLNMVTLAQGPLTPPSAPGSTFRSLLDVEPRFPIYHYGTNLSRSGCYFLATNLVGNSTNIDGISISADHITLDFNGFALINTSGPEVSAEGVSITARDNITVRNGTIQGFLRGIFANGNCPGILVENMRLATNYQRGIMLSLPTDGVGGIVRYNYVYGTGGTTTGAANQEIRGIEVSGGSFVVEHNVVVGVYGKGTSAGFGIYMALNTNSFALNNRVSAASFGIRMNGPNEYRDNMTSGCDTNYLAGTDRGNNF